MIEVIQSHRASPINRNHLRFSAVPAPLFAVTVSALALLLAITFPGKLYAYQQQQQQATEVELAAPVAVDMITKWLLSNKFISPAKLAAVLQNVEVETVKPRGSISSPSSFSSATAKTGPVASPNGGGDIVSIGSQADSTLTPISYKGSSCQMVQIVHLLHQDGCHPKAIASFACSGTCPSYVQTSSSKFWQHERSCSCCQQASLQEATFTLDCPSLEPPYRKVKTYAPVECLCRACTDLGRENLRPQELVDAMAGDANDGVSSNDQR